jgi:hypothetical protein
VTERGVPESDREQFAVVPVPASSAVVADHGPPTPAARARAESARSTAGEDITKSAVAENFAAPPPVPAPEPKAAAPDDRHAEALAGPGEGRAAGAAAMADEASARDSSREDERPARRKSNCEAERAHYDEVAADPAQANGAKWALARCYDASGRVEQARSSYTALLTVPSYAERAKKALDDLATSEAQPRAGTRARATAKPARPAAAAPPAATESQ